jgi:hypothetical protein
MFPYIFISVLVALWAWMAYEISRAPFLNKSDEPPITTEWHDDDYYPDTKP